MIKAGGNRAPTLSLLEQKDYEKIEDNDNGSPWMLVHDRKKVEKYWSSVMLPIFDPSIFVPIGPEFQINESSWVGFTFHGTFYALDTLFF